MEAKMEAKKEALWAVYEAERERLNNIQGSDGIYASPVFGVGNLSPALALIGEAPGAMETEQGIPFVGKAGRQLEELLRLAGLKREEIFVTNAVKYRPITPTRTGMKNRTPTRTETLNSLYVLRAELNLLKPSVIVTLGNIPLFALTELYKLKRVVIGDVHGKCIKAEDEGREFVIYPMYHPASVIYNRSLLTVCEEDAKRLRLFW